MLSGKWVNKTDLTDLVGLIFKVTGMIKLLELSVAEDSKNDTKYLLKVF